MQIQNTCILYSTIKYIVLQFKYFFVWLIDCFTYVKKIYSFLQIVAFILNRLADASVKYTIHIWTKFNS